MIYQTCASGLFPSLLLSSLAVPLLESWLNIALGTEAAHGDQRQRRLLRIPFSH